MIAIDNIKRRLAVALGLALAAGGAAQAGGIVGQTLPADFPVILDASLGTPLIGFGAAGRAVRTPVIFVHGNDATPFPTGCEKAHTNFQAMAQYFADQGYSPNELWAVGYQGDQCDSVDFGAHNSAGAGHTHAANVADVIAFAKAVLASTGASRLDVVAHGMGVTLAREAVRQSGAMRVVRRFVAIDGPNHGIEMCSPSPANYWQLGFSGGYTPDSPLCQEIGSPQTPFLKTLNSRSSPQINPESTLVIRNGDSSYPYIPWNDGLLVTGVPAIDSFGNPTDFTESPRIRGARDLMLTGQQAYDVFQNTAHIGIANSPVTWQAAFSFLNRKF